MGDRVRSVFSNLDAEYMKGFYAKVAYLEHSSIDKIKSYMAEGKSFIDGFEFNEDSGFWAKKKVSQIGALEEYSYSGEKCKDARRALFQHVNGKHEVEFCWVNVYGFDYVVTLSREGEFSSFRAAKDLNNIRSCVF